jgi:HAD superfamily hydrolase (TIGR01509 family)
MVHRMTRFPSTTHVLYDMDGLLLDTEPFYTEVTQAIVSRYGHTFEWSLKAKMIGKKAADSARILVDALQLPITPDDYLRERESLLAALFPTAQAMPGARRLTAHLAAHGIPQAVASSSHRREFELKVEQHREWFGCFQCVVLGDDPEVNRGKPAPDIFLAAAARMGAEPSRCLVLEDAPSGVEAARAAGMPVVAVPNPAMNPDAYRDAAQILPSLESFDPEFWGLPAYPGFGVPLSRNT